MMQKTHIERTFSRWRERRLACYMPFLDLLLLTLGE